MKSGLRKSYLCLNSGGLRVLAGFQLSHLIANILKDEKFKLTIVHGTERPQIIKGINHLHNLLT